MPYRCPYCQKNLPEPAPARCPHCDRAMRPPAQRPGSAWRERRRVKERIRRDADRQRRALGTLVGAPRRSPLQLGAILAVLVLVGALVISGARRPTRRPPPDPVATAQREIKVLRASLEWFRVDTGRYPRPEEGLTALIVNPDLATWQGPYVTVLRADPWGQPYRYTLTDGLPHVSSSGADGLPDTPDDLSPHGWERLQNIPTEGAAATPPVEASAGGDW